MSVPQVSAEILEFSTTIFKVGKEGTMLLRRDDASSDHAFQELDAIAKGERGWVTLPQVHRKLGDFVNLSNSMVTLLRRVERSCNHCYRSSRQNNQNGQNKDVNKYRDELIKI